MSKSKITRLQNIEKLIFNIRGFQVMIDFHLFIILLIWSNGARQQYADCMFCHAANYNHPRVCQYYCRGSVHLAEMYGVETKRLNEQVKRNQKRFPESFMFQLTTAEWKTLQSQIATLKQITGLQSQIATAKRRTLPYAFTEQGVAMLSSVLNTETAIVTSIQIMQAFVAMRKFLLNNASVFQRLDQVELKQLKTDEKIEQIFKALEAGKPEPDKGIFFHGQIFDAYVFVSDLIKKAKVEIILIDNYIDETSLTLLSKKAPKVKVLLLTKNITTPLALDVKKANEQFGKFEVKELRQSHDRFVIIDQKELYHIGASLKDLGKKWFAFSKMEGDIPQLMLDQLKREGVI